MPNTSALSSAAQKKRLLLRIKRYIPLYIIFLPVFIYYIIFCYIPMGGIVIAFKHFTIMGGIFGSPWVGLENFERFFQNGDFWTVFKNTIVLAFYRILFGFPAPIIFALLLNEIRFGKYKRVIQTVSYLPHFISWVVVYGLLYNFFSADGFVNQIIKLVGGQQVLFLSMPKYFRALFVGSGIWKELGWGAIIYLASLASINTELYEAAMIDGANRFQRMWHITLPGIRSVISIMFVLSMGGLLSVSFEQVLVMINPSVSSVADVIDYYIYSVGLKQINNFSYATAVGLFRSVLSLILVLVTNSIAKRIDEEGAIW
jgi:putative aldouronate transport system permease protein